MANMFIRPPPGLEALSGYRTPPPPSMMYSMLHFSDNMGTGADGACTPRYDGAYVTADALRDKLLKLEADALPQTFHPLFAGMPQEVPAPPQPHHVQRPARQEVAQPSAVISKGSVGHPFSCAEACKYVKRKDGCRDGAQCTKCHQCFWSKEPKKGPAESSGKSELPSEPVVFSVGTVGHPYNCSAACKYARRKGGCRDGEECTSCHYCKWQRSAVAMEADSQGLFQAAQSQMQALQPLHVACGMQQLQDPDASVGSVGHPYSCAAACKFHSKKGCKDGAACVHCHKCIWTRQSAAKIFRL